MHNIRVTNVSPNVPSSSFQPLHRKSRRVSN
ncbi:MAG: DUF3678 domain-containing protein [candidate division Zixibacteria bacterium]|nr:DUF3678 domain-containing protein [candidate division Zixibacteria bacterium]